VPHAGQKVRNLIAKTVAPKPAAQRSAKDYVAAAPAKPLGERTPRPATHLQIVAHADDDLYFMNPELHQAVLAGTGIVSVYLTSGEADGKNVANFSRDHDSTPVDFAGYSSARMNGLRAAYSYMATGDRAVPWTRETRLAPNGVQMEIATLTANPDIRLIFVSLSAGPRDLGVKRLCHVWTGRNQEQPTLAPTGSPKTDTGSYTREDLVDLVESLCQEFRPTVVRTLDPDPEHLSVRENGHVEYSDHSDHTAAAYIALRGLAQYRQNGGDEVRVRLYRAYYNTHWPLTLGPETFARKITVLDIYGGADPHECADPAGCGDFKVGQNARTRVYAGSTLTRFDEETDWLQRMPDGRLTAFEVTNGVVRQWIQGAPDSPWQVRALDDADLMPEISVLMQHDGRIRLFGIRVRLRANYDNQRREVVTTVQLEPGGAFGEWVGLSNPDYGNDWYRTHEIGTPVGAVAADGRVHMFTRNFEAGVSTRLLRAAGTWRGWQDLGGSELQGGLSAVELPNGRIEVFGNTKTGLARYVQTEVNGELKHDTGFTGIGEGEPAPSGRPTAVADGDGRIALFFRRHRDEAVSVLRQERDGTWDAVPAPLPGGHGGAGGVAVRVLPGDGETAGPAAFLVAVRNRDGGISHTTTHLDGRRTEWVADSSLVVGAPSIALDAQDRPVIAAFGADGHLYLRHVAEADDTWRRAG
jgi:LmbE family N-acetylglucosaminyl deacetylase